MENDYSHGSPLRYLMARSSDKDYVAADDLKSATKMSNAYGILEGDDGGTIYATIPVSIIICSKSELHKLLCALDEIVWPSNEEDMRRIVYEPHNVGDTVAGGMGGGKIDVGVWVHPELHTYYEKIVDIVTGKLSVSDVNW